MVALVGEVRTRWSSLPPLRYRVARGSPVRGSALSGVGGKHRAHNTATHQTPRTNRPPTTITHTSHTPCPQPIHATCHPTPKTPPAVVSRANM